MRNKGRPWILREEEGLIEGVGLTEPTRVRPVWGTGRFGEIVLVPAHGFLHVVAGLIFPVLGHVVHVIVNHQLGLTVSDQTEIGIIDTIVIERVLLNCEILVPSKFQVLQVLFEVLGLWSKFLRLTQVRLLAVLRVKLRSLGLV